MILFLYGTDTYRSRRQLHKMIDKFKADRDPQGLNVVRIDATKPGKVSIMEQILALPFLAEKRMVVVENLFATKEVELFESLLTRIQEKTIPKSTVLVFWEEKEKPVSRTKIAKELFTKLKKVKFAQEFTPIEGPKLMAWIAAEAKSRGGVIGRQTAHYLAQHVQNMWQLSNLIDQLIAYKGEKEITVADAQLFLEQRADDNIFNLVDAIVGRNPKKVYQMIQRQYDNGENALYIFAMVVRQFRILLQLRDLFDREGTMQSNVLADKLGLHPFVVKKSLPLVKRYSMASLTEIYQQLLSLDRNIKTGRGRPEMLLDVFVGNVSVGV